MKKFVKNAMLVLLTGGMVLSAAIGFTACSNTPDVPKDDDNKHEQVVPNPDDGKDDPTKPPVVDDKQALENAAGTILAVLDEAKEAMNFHYVEGKANFYAQTLSDGFKLKYSVGNTNEYYIGTKTDAGAYDNVMRIYQDENGNWVGETAKEEIVSENPLRLYDAEWTVFEDGHLIGTVEGEQVSATVNDNLTAILWTVNGQNFQLDQIGEINLQIPEFTDLTKPAEEYVYQTVNGQREYNIPLLAKTLEEVLKANPDILKKANGSVSTNLKKVTHIKDNEDGLVFGAYCFASNGTKCYKAFTFKNRFVEDNLTVEALENALTVGSLKMVDSFPFETSTFDNDEEFNIMAKNIMVKLAQDGCQGNSINNQGEALPEFNNAKVVLGFKTENSPTTSGGDLGIQSASDYLFVVKESNGNVEEINLRVAVAYSWNGENDNLVNYDASKVLVVTLERENILKDNIKLYDDNNKISPNTEITPYFEEKRY